MQGRKSRWEPGGGGYASLRQVRLRVRGRPGPQSEFQTARAVRRNPVLRRTKRWERLECLTRPAPPCFGKVSYSSWGSQSHFIVTKLRPALRADAGLSHTCFHRVPEPGSTAADPQASTTDTASSEQFGNSRRTSARVHRNWNKPGPTGYLHQIRH